MSRQDSGRVLLLRTVSASGESHGGFRWPLEVGAEVEAPDWDPNPVCGGGLHGLLWGEGVGGLLDWSPDSRWLVISADAADVVDLRGKVKVPRARVEHVGDRESATSYLLDHGASGRAVVGTSVLAGDHGTATAGDYGTAAAGVCGTATAGVCGTATAGDYGTATAGDYGTATAGNYGTATAGDHGTATAGDYGTATAGVYGTATAGVCGTATAGRGGTATAGDHGTATAGVCGTATAGDHGTATAGDRGTATAGDRGTLILRRWADDRYRTHVAYVGEGGIEPGVAYRLDRDGGFMPAEEER